MSDAQRVIKNTIFLSIANTLPRITQAVVIFIAARTLGDVGLGKYYTIASLVGLTNLFTDLGITSSFTKEVAQHKNQASKYFFNFFVVKIFLGFLSYFSLVAITYLLNYSLDILHAAYIYGFYMAIWAVAGLFLALFQAFEEMKYNAWMWGISGITNLFISLYLLFSGHGFTSPIWGLTGGALIAFILGLVILQKQITFSFSYFDFRFLKHNLKIAFPFALNSIFSSIYFRLDSIILSKLETEQVMGWFGAAFKLLDNLVILPQFFLGAIYPALCRFYNEDQEKFKWVFSESLKVIAMGAFPITIGLLLLAQKIMLFLYGPSFVNGTLSLQILSFALLCVFFTSLGVVSLMAMGQMKIANLVGAINIFNSALLCFFLIPKQTLGLSLNGAALTTLACELFGLIVFGIYFYQRKVFRRNILVDLGKPLLSGIVMGVVVYLSLPYNLVINIVLGAVVYFLVLFLLKGFEKHEIDLIKGLLKK